MTKVISVVSSTNQIFVQVVVVPVLGEVNKSPIAIVAATAVLAVLVRAAVLVVLVAAAAVVVFVA